MHLDDKRANASILQNIPGTLFQAERNLGPVRDELDHSLFHTTRTSEVWNFGWLLKVQPDRPPLVFVHGQLSQPSTTSQQQPRGAL